MRTTRCNQRFVHRKSVVWFAVVTCIAASAPRAPSQPWDLWQIKADGGGLRRFSDTPDYICGSPDWSPDGKLVAYDTWPAGKPFQASQIAVLRADGTHRRILGSGAMPSWSPDGTQIVCHTYENPQSIIVMNADGSGREKILSHWGSPRWSPRGNRIASILNGDIALYDLATGRENRLLRGPYSPRQGFAISPDGLRFCFGDSNDGIAVATLNERTMSASVSRLAKAGSCHCVSWAPDGKRVVVGWQPPEAKFAQLYVFYVDESTAPIPIAGQDITRHNYNPDWSPDGKTIVFASLPGDIPK